MLWKASILVGTLLLALGVGRAFAQTLQQKRTEITQFITINPNRLTDEQLGWHIKGQQMEPTEFCDQIPAYSGCVIQKAAAARRRQEAQELRAKQEEEHRQGLLNKVKFPVLETKLMQAVSFRINDVFGVSIDVQIRCKKAGTGLIRVRPFDEGDVPRPTDTKTFKCVLAEDVLDVSFKTTSANRYVIDFPTISQKK